MEPSKILFVVNRNRVDLYEQLRRSFADQAAVEVVLDRRHGERRRVATGASRSERRRDERRIRTVARTLEANAFAVVRRLPARIPSLTPVV